MMSVKDELDRLRAENEGLKNACNLIQDIEVENGRLRAENERLREIYSVNGAETDELRRECRELRAELEAFKVECGSCIEERVQFKAIKAENERLRRITERDGIALVWE